MLPNINDSKLKLRFSNKLYFIFNVVSIFKSLKTSLPDHVFKSCSAILYQGCESMLAIVWIKRTHCLQNTYKKKMCEMIIQTHFILLYTRSFQILETYIFTKCLWMFKQHRHGTNGRYTMMDFHISLDVIIQQPQYLYFAVQYYVFPL